MSSPEPPVVVLDTNVLLDWLVFHDPRIAALTTAVESGAVRWLSVPRMRDELAHVLGRGSLERWQPDSQQVLAAFDRFAVQRPTAARCALHCADVDDQPFIDLALAEQAAWLVTRDRALLALAGKARAHGVLVVTPARWQALP